MNWQERIERQIQEIDDKERAEQARKLKLGEQRLASLLEMAESLKIEHVLREIRDQVWQLGEVSSIIAPDKPLVAFFLRAEWPCYRGGHMETVYGEYSTREEWVDDPHEGVHKKELCILCKYNDEEKMHVYFHFDESLLPFAWFNFSSAEKTRQEIEESLVKYYARPLVNEELPYREKARKDLEILERWKK